MVLLFLVRQKGLGILRSCRQLDAGRRVSTGHPHRMVRAPSFKE